MANIEHLPPNSVVSTVEAAIYVGSKMFTVEELLTAIKGTGHHSSKREWFEEGASCQILSPNRDWVKGKMKITIEFHPDQPTSDPELEKLRQQIL